MLVRVQTPVAQEAPLHGLEEVQVVQALPPLPHMEFMVPVKHPPLEVKHPRQQAPAAHLPLLPLLMQAVPAVWATVVQLAFLHFPFLQGREVAQEKQASPLDPHRVSWIPVRH